MYVEIIIGRKEITVIGHSDKKDVSGKAYEKLYHPQCEFFVVNYFRLSMTILRKQAMAQAVMVFLQENRISVGDLRYIGGKSSGRPKKISVKQMELF